MTVEKKMNYLEKSREKKIYKRKYMKNPLVFLSFFILLIFISSFLFLSNTGLDIFCFLFFFI